MSCTSSPSRNMLIVRCSRTYCITMCCHAPGCDCPVSDVIWNFSSIFPPALRTDRYSPLYASSA
eukprot:3936578-Rhodomonas_salina.3